MSETSSEQRNGAAITYVLTGLLSWLGGLIGWLIWRGRGEYARVETTEALNFGLTTLLAFVVVHLLARIIPFLDFLTTLIWIVQLVLSVIGAMAASRGESYRYPFALRLVS